MSTQSVVRGGGTKRIGLALIIVGALAFVACAVTIAVRIGPALGKGLTGRAYATPMDQVVTLTRGKWVVFQRNGTQSGGGGFTYSQENAITIAPSDVEVTDAGGRPVRTSELTANETITRNGAIYSGAVSFEVSSGGRYRIEIAQPGDQMLLSRDLGSLFVSVLGFILGAVGSMFVIGAGAIVLIVRASRRHRHRQTGPPPGLYPHPTTPGQMLYWNGAQWGQP